MPTLPELLLAWLLASLASLPIILALCAANHDPDQE